MCTSKWSDVDYDSSPTTLPYWHVLQTEIGAFDHCCLQGNDHQCVSSWSETSEHAFTHTRLMSSICLHFFSLPIPALLHTMSSPPNTSFVLLNTLFYLANWVEVWLPNDWSYSSRASICLPVLLFVRHLLSWRSHLSWWTLPGGQSRQSAPPPRSHPQYWPARPRVIAFATPSQTKLAATRLSSVLEHEAGCGQPNASSPASYQLANIPVL